MAHLINIDDTIIITVCDLVLWLAHYKLHVLF